MRNEIDRGLRKICLSEAECARIRERIAHMESGVGSDKRKGTIKKRSRGIGTLKVLVAAVLLVFALSALCVAAELPWKFMQLFESVNEASVYDGIELRIMSAAADEDSVMIFYTLEDLEGGRISASTQIYDYNLTGPATMGTFMENYDEKTKTATFLFMGDNIEGMRGEKLTFSLQSFLNGSSMEMYKMEPNVGDLMAKRAEDHGEALFQSHPADRDWVIWNAQNDRGAVLQEEWMKKEESFLLQGEPMALSLPGVDWVTVTNMGYQDGWLHVRVKYDEEKGKINHGYLCLTDSTGAEMENAILNSPLSDGREEFIISIDDRAELNDLYLGGFFTNNQSLHTGEWKVTFEVNGLASKTVACQVETEDLSVHKAVLSPLGVTIYGIGEREDHLLLQMKDGTQVSTEGSSGSGDGETKEFTCKYKFAEPLDIDQVQWLMISGQQVDVL